MTRSRRGALKIFAVNLSAVVSDQFAVGLPLRLRTLAATLVQIGVRAGGPPYRSTMEVAMRIAIMTAVAPLLLITGVTLSAAATDAKQALSMCDARGDACRMNIDNYGNVTLLVQNSGGTGVQGSSR
jgi:hypothetical protein